jgi:hypothetical protein
MLLPPPLDCVLDIFGRACEIKGNLIHERYGFERGE